MTQQTVKILTGDVMETLKTLPADYFDAVLSDPPYGISFMGKEWDKGVPSAETYKELHRVLKPGAFGLHFGGTRMWHRLAVNLEDAGFELRDTLMWLYGSGFPKSHNISKALDKVAGAEREVVGVAGKSGSTRGCMAGDFAGGEYMRTAPATPEAVQWDGYGTALKPAWEPAVLVQKTLDKTYANNAITHGCGGLNIDGCRVGTTDVIANHSRSAVAALSKGRYGDSAAQGTHQTHGQTLGRFPANLILDEAVGELLDEQTGGPTVSGKAVRRSHQRSDAQATSFGSNAHEMTAYGDSGGASRFFYCAKVSSKERNAGLGDDFPRQATITIYTENDEWNVSNTTPEGNRVTLQVAMGQSHQRATVVSGVSESDASEWNTILFGNSTTEQSQKGCKSTTETGTSSTTPSGILSYLTHCFTNASTATAVWKKVFGSSSAEDALSGMPWTVASISKRETLIVIVSTAESNKRLSISVRDESAPTKSDHPTLKPLALTEYLAKLLLVPKRTDGQPRRILVPFSGAGSELIGCLKAGWDEVVGIEIDPEYVRIAHARIRHHVPTCGIDQ